jgi:hypothetical protein
VGLLLNPCSGLIRFNEQTRFMLLELFARDCQVGPTCQRKCDHMSDTQEIFLLSLESLGCHPRRVDDEW